MQLQELWDKYSHYHEFNSSILPEEILSQGVRLTYQPGAVILNRGDFPNYIYFLESGVALGSRQYDDGNNFYYFHVTPKTGSVGLLEVLARQPRIIATIVASTEVTVLRIRSAIIYEYLMSHIDMLYNCTYIVAQDLYSLSGKQGVLYYRNSIDRVRYYLVQYYTSHGKDKKDLLIADDYQTIAGSLGISVRTVVRSMQTLKKLGEITSEKKRLYLSYQQHLALLKKIEPFFSS